MIGLSEHAGDIGELIIALRAAVYDLERLVEGDDSCLDSIEQCKIVLEKWSLR